MFGPGSASGPYTLVMRSVAFHVKEFSVNDTRMVQRCCSRLQNNMNVDMGDIRSHHFRNVVYHVWAR